MALHVQSSDPILVGSGELYIGAVADPENAAETTIEAALKNIGIIESGATLTYSNDIKEIESANRGLILSFVTKQKIEFDCGIMTWVFDNLELLCPGTVETDATTGTKKIKIGAKKTLPVNYLRFIHEKHDGSGQLIINIYRATPNSGFALSFDRENPLTVGYKFTGLAAASGNMCEIIETFYPEKEVLTTSATNQVTLSQTPGSIVGVWLSADGVTKGTEQVAGNPSTTEGTYSLSGSVITLNAVSAPENALVIVEYYV